MKLGQPVRICTHRPHIEQYNGLTGQIVVLTNADIAYVCFGKFTVAFYLDELQEFPAEGGAA